MSPPEPSQESGAKAQWFSTTHWTVVRDAADSASPGAQEALEKLCRTYWYPLYAYIRRKGHSVEDAEDLTQGFFEQMLERRSLKQVRGTGKFRSFLLAALEHYLATEWNRAHRQKRGGQSTMIPLETAALETRYQLEPAEELTPERIYDRRWAMTVLAGALGALRKECAAAGKEKLFEALKPLLSGDKTDTPYAEIGARLELSDSALKVAAYRLRQRYGELVRAEIAQTVTTQTELDEEIHHLFAVLRG